MSLFETKKLGEMAPATRLVVYGLLGLWTLIVLFPLYWVVVTSVKLPIQVSNGPVYLPFIDYQPSLHAWRYIFVDIARDTFRPYLNSLIVAIASTSFAMAAGSLAAYALSRFAFRPRLLTIAIFIARHGARRVRSRTLRRRLAPGRRGRAGADRYCRACLRKSALAASLPIPTCCSG